MTSASEPIASLLSLQGKIALVTGGSSGIGAETVKLLAAAGASVCVGYHSGMDRAEALAASLPGDGHWSAPLSLNEPGTAQTLRDQLAARGGKLDILINSAGYTRPVAHRDLETMDEALFAEILQANVVGPFSVIRAMMPLLEASGQACVINISSISAFTGSGSSIAYCAAKAGLDTMTRSFAKAFGPKVRFLCVSPAAVATGFVAGRERGQLEAIAKDTPLKVVTEAADVARAVLAAVALLRNSTGVRIIVDGGRHL